MLTKIMISLFLPPFFSHNFNTLTCWAVFNGKWRFQKSGIGEFKGKLCNLSWGLLINCSLFFYLSHFKLTLLKLLARVHMKFALSEVFHWVVVVISKFNFTWVYLIIIINSWHLFMFGISSIEILVS